MRLTGNPAPEGLHSADVDTSLCAKVYFELERVNSKEISVSIGK